MKTAYLLVLSALISFNVQAASALETYAANELVISQIWLDMGEAATMNDAVSEWKRRDKPSLKFSCSAFKPCEHSESIAGGLPACIKDVELVVSAKAISVQVNFRPLNPGQVIEPRTLADLPLDYLRTSSEQIKASWDGGEDSLQLKASESDEGVRKFVANFETDPNGPSGLTFDQDLNYGLECSFVGYSK